MSGLLVDGDRATDASIIQFTEARKSWTVEQEQLVRDAHLIRSFLQQAPNQLTYAGLFEVRLVPPSRVTIELCSNSCRLRYKKLLCRLCIVTTIYLFCIDVHNIQQKAIACQMRNCSSLFRTRLSCTSLPSHGSRSSTLTGLLQHSTTRI